MVRQNCLHFLRDHKNYPISILAVEKGFKVTDWFTGLILWHIQKKLFH
jgi:hypothetical protein